MTTRIEQHLAELKRICEIVATYPLEEREAFRSKADMEVMMVNPPMPEKEIKYPVRHESSGLAESLKKVIYGQDYKHLK